MADRGKVPAGDFIDAYILEPSELKRGFLSAISEYTRIETKNFFSRSTDRLEEEWNVSPYNTLFVEDWLRGVRDSTLVVADSFHALCFSIIFRKPFVAISNAAVVRFTSLVGLLGLEDRLITNDEQLRELLPHVMDIDWDAVHERLDAAKAPSIEFLKKAVAPLEEERFLSTYDVIMDMLAKKERHSYTINNKQLLWLKEKRVVVWGAGAWGNTVLEMLADLNITVHKLLDSYAGNRAIHVGRVTFSAEYPDVLNELDPHDYRVVVAVKHSASIQSKLKEAGFEYKGAREIFKSPLLV
jgi:hypothetical protein